MSDSLCFKMSKAKSVYSFCNLDCHVNPTFVLNDPLPSAVYLDVVEINIGKLGYIDVSRGEGFTKIVVYKEKKTEGQVDPEITRLEVYYVEDADLI